MKKILAVLLAILAPIVLMAQNVGALELSGLQWQSSYSDPWDWYGFASSSGSSNNTPKLLNSNTFTYVLQPPYNLAYFQFHNSYPALAKGYYYYAVINISVVGHGWQGYSSIPWVWGSTAGRQDTLNSRIIDITQTTNNICQTVYENCANNYRITVQLKNDVVTDGNWKLQFGRVDGTFFQVPPSAGDTTIIIQPTTVVYRLNPSQASTDLEALNNINQAQKETTEAVNNVNDTLQQQQQQDQQDRDDLQNTSDESKDQAEEASGEATAQATSLLQAFISFVNWVADIKATNCNLNIGELYGFNIGTLNLCTYSPPQWVSGALAIVIGLAIAGMSYHIVTRIIKIYQTIIGGDKS